VWAFCVCECVSWQVTFGLSPLAHSQFSCAAPERFVSFIIKAKVNFFQLCHSVTLPSPLSYAPVTNLSWALFCMRPCRKTHYFLNETLALCHCLLLVPHNPPDSCVLSLPLCSSWSQSQLTQENNVAAMTSEKCNIFAPISLHSLSATPFRQPIWPCCICNKHVNENGKWS